MPAVELAVAGELAWHFVGAERKLRDGRPLVVGEWLEHDGPLVLCRSGLHASTRALDALQYAPGPVACLVEIGGEIIRDDTKLACRRRRPLWAVDAGDALRLFARQCALDVAHLWEMPALVRQYLETGDESIRAAAWAAARAAAWDADWDAAWAAAWAAASAAARDAAWDAAWDRQNRNLESLLYACAQDTGWEP